MNVLVFPCGSEIALEVYKSLKDQKNVNLFGASSVSDSGRFVFDNYISDVPFITDSNFIESIKSIVTEFSIDAIFPCVDIIMPLLKSNEDMLGCKVVTSPLETVEICLSKRKTYRELSDVVKTPKEFQREDDLKYPLFLKPEIGSSSRNTFLVKNSNELDFHLSKNLNLMILEYLPGDEFTVDCFTDFNGNLLYTSARKRKRIINGISVESELIECSKINDIARKINSSLKLNGSWFFQLKTDNEGDYGLLEVATRFGGSSLLQRYLGVNFSMLSLLNIFNIPVEIESNNIEIETCRNLDVKFKMNINYSKVYVDYDDTIIINDNVNCELIKVLYHLINCGKEIILITKHRGDLHNSISKYRLTNLFDRIIHLSPDDDKSKYVTGDSIFIDDSFSERKNIKNKIKIPVFEPCTVNCLL